MPKLIARHPCALNQRLELGPDKLGMNSATQTTVRPGHDVLPTDQVGVPHDAVGHDLRVLHDIGGVTHHARDEHLAIGKFDIPPDLPLMLMASTGNASDSRDSRQRSSPCSVVGVKPSMRSAT